MMVEHDNWVEEVLQTRVRVLDGFAETVRDLNIDRDQIRGDVLIIGSAGACPERALVCTSSSRYRTLRQEIDSLVCCDFDLPLRDGIFHLAVNPLPLHDAAPYNKETIYFYFGAVQRVFKENPQRLYDAILFFRVLGLEDKLREGLSDQVARVLKPGGLFLGSGCFYWEEVDLPKDFRTFSVAKLPNPDYGHYMYSHFHMGFVAQKVI